MKNLFLKFISESSNFNQERISFINSVRKNSNLRPFSLINEAPAPAPQIAPSDPDDFDRYAFNRWTDNTFGRFPTGPSGFNPDTPTDGFMIFDSLLRDLLGQSYSTFPPSFITYLYQVMGGNLDSLRNFINTINNVSYTTSSGTQVAGGTVFQQFLMDLATLNWISSNLTSLNNLNSSTQLQELLQNNPNFHAEVLYMIEKLQGQNGPSKIFDRGTFYMNIFQSFMQQGIVFPANFVQFLERWATSLTDFTFNITNPGLSGTIGVVSPQNLPNPTAVTNSLTNSLNLPNNPAIWNIFQIIQNSYNNGGPMSFTQLQIAANQMGISPERLSELLVYTNALPQDQFNALMQNIAQAHQNGNMSGILDAIMATALQNPGNGQTYETIRQILMRIWRSL